MTTEPVGRKILYVNHTSRVAGAERSLLDLLDQRHPEVAAAVACPPGELAAHVRSRGLPIYPIPGSDLSHRVHPLHTPRELVRLVRTASAIRRLCRRHHFALVHANTTRAGLAAIAARACGGPPVVVHVRDPDAPGPAGRLTLRAIAAGAACVVANSHFVASQFRRTASRGFVKVVYNSVDPLRFDPDRIDRDEARRMWGFSGDEVVLTVVGQLTPVKGQDDAVRILASLKPQNPSLRLLLVGSPTFTAAAARYDSVSFEGELRRLTRALELDRDVVFAGQRDDVPRVLRATDILLVPSWRESFGRVVIEGLAMGVPIISTAEGGPREILQDGVEGVLLPPQHPEQWAQAVARLIREPSLRAAMGTRGRKRARDFSPSRTMNAIAAIYDDLLA